MRRANFVKILLMNNKQMFPAIVPAVALGQKYYSGAFMDNMGDPIILPFCTTGTAAEARNNMIEWLQAWFMSYFYTATKENNGQQKVYDQNGNILGDWDYFLYASSPSQYLNIPNVLPVIPPYVSLNHNEINYYLSQFPSLLNINMIQGGSMRRRPHNRRRRNTRRSKKRSIRRSKR